VCVVPDSTTLTTSKIRRFDRRAECRTLKLLIMESIANNPHSRKRRQPGWYKLETQRRIHALINQLTKLSELLIEGNEREHGTINYWLDMIEQNMKHLF
jgi:hypothetical protein